MLGVVLARPLIYGIKDGAAYGLVAVGLVLIYKSSRIFNFAAGEFVTLGAFATFLASKGFHLKLGLFGVHVHFHLVPLPFLMAALIGVLLGAGAGLLTERLVVRPLADRPRVVLLVATAAIAITLIPVQLTFGAGRAYSFRPLIRGTAFHLFGVFVTWQQLLVVVVLILVGTALAAFFGFTDLGLAVLASSQEPTASRLMGIRLNRVAMLTWGMAGALGGLAGVLLPPTTGSPGQFFPAYGTTDVLIFAFTAAVLGGMTSVPGAFLGGLIVGIVQDFAQSNFTKIQGPSSIAVLVVLVGVLLIRPSGILGKEA
ncbi:MAG: branched-chain amino acid transport system permease protein [Acidimicrobiaceae bacterium]|jgi:branched-chain amino acid transport system permease protein|nr:branched-chain amino acid transport system permease protein [Acidimicrobiaceae bacterium]